MAIVDIVKFDGPTSVLAWKYPNQELGTWTQLIVNESQEALLFKGGQALDLFSAGRHTLSTNNLPFLSSLVNLPFGGKSPFTAEVWFVNKLQVLDVKWGTASPVQIQDPRYQIIVSVRAFGQLSIQIEDSRKFLLKLIGTVPFFDKTNLSNHFRSLVMMNFNELITTYLAHKKISILEINAYITEISSHIEARIAPVFAEFGIRLASFYVDSVNTPENDPATIRLKEALAKKAEMDIIGYSYQQQRTFDTLEGAARNEGSSSSIFMGAALGSGMGQGFSSLLGNAVGGLNGQMGPSSSVKSCPRCQAANNSNSRFCNGCGQSLIQEQAPVPAPQGEMCTNCGKMMQLNAKFCSDCGDPYTPCSSCKADNPVDALHCYKCNQPLRTACRQCGVLVPTGAKHCTECGTSVSMKCSQCQHEVKPGQKFCLDCGHKLIE
ncbi:Double zinc ribbon [compost metagenome]